MPNLLNKLLGDPNVRELRRAQTIVERVNACSDQIGKLSDNELGGQTVKFRARLAQGEKLDALLPEAYATVREMSQRITGMRHFDVQILGGAILHEGKIAEMRTGEGKTIVAPLALYLNALTGKGVHLVTVNDYLARIGAGWMGAVFHALGLSTGIIVPDQVLGTPAYLYDPEYSDETATDPRLVHLRPVSRRAAYEADITYGTNNEFGFDYLRDNMVDEAAKMVQRELHYAIVDEVDSILIDEARTPLIISAPAEESTDKYYDFARLARTLTPAADYTIDEKLKAASLTDDGVVKIERALGVDNVYEAGRIDDVHHIEQSLKAEALFIRDRDYVVREGEIIIVDEFTGRLMPGRRWSEGLHQAVEAKEGVHIQQESLTLATITFQNYFRLYPKLAGMTGTAATEAEEFGKIYALDVTTIPTHHPMVRVDLPDRIYKTEAGKFRAVAREVAERHAKGQPVLIGTVSIEKNERLSTILNDMKIPHQLLNAKNNETEAATIAAAGHRGAVTLATNIAGRGTDIVLEPGVAEVGGLHVLGTERHESRRIDNQLRGRAGRQGDPGSSQFYVSLDDDLMRIFGSDRIAGLMTSLGLDEDTPIENSIVSRSLESAQKKVEGHNFDTRKQIVEYDDVMNKHREVVYARRRRALTADDLRPDTLAMIQRQYEAMVSAHTDTRTDVTDHDALAEAAGSIIPFSAELGDSLERAHRSEMVSLLMAATEALYDHRTEEFGQHLMIIVERLNYIRALDGLWIEHLEAMEALRNGIGLRSIGQRDPLIEYKREGYRMFNQLLELMEGEIATKLFKITVTHDAEEAPVETALTRAASHATSNAAETASLAGGSGESRAQRRAKPSAEVDAVSATKKKKKRR